jgi:hypothetical protein
MNSSIPIEASGFIPLSQSDVSTIPSVAFGIPDFEGQAILRIFSNSTRSEIGCYASMVTNGVSLSQPLAVNSILALFVLATICSSTALAIYGTDVPSLRTHYAHSPSVFVIFSVFQHIYFTGALSVNWPSVLVAFWSNYAWFAGMIYTEKIQNSINWLTASNRGNISLLGAMPSGTGSENLGGGYALSHVYGQNLPRSSAILHERTPVWSGPIARRLPGSVPKIAVSTFSSGSSWYGSRVKPGLPLPGNYSGFAGTLAQESIPASNAFLTGLLWFVFMVVAATAAIATVKLVVEAFTRLNVIKTERFGYFRRRWLAFLVAAVLRIFFIGFFMIMFLTLFQLTLGGSSRVIAIAAVVFVLFFTMMWGMAAYALFYRLRASRVTLKPDRVLIERTRILGRFPWCRFTRQTRKKEKPTQQYSSVSVPWWYIHHIGQDENQISVHADEGFLVRFGWLSARFRRSRWWFFAAWLVYEFTRACFFGGAAGHAMIQVFGLLSTEFIALIFIVRMKPFEATRLNVLMVYLLGFSKISTLALSAAFDARFNLERITTTIIGIAIIIIQAVLTICLLVAIFAGGISSYISLTRHRENSPEHCPRGPFRVRYLDRIERAATGLPQPPAQPPSPVSEIPKEPYFRVTSVKRFPKIEDEDADSIAELKLCNPGDSESSIFGRDTVVNLGPRNRCLSVQSYRSHSNLPFGALLVRASWSSRGSASCQDEQRNSAVSASSDLAGDPGAIGTEADASLRETTIPQRANPPETGTAPLQTQRQALHSQKANPEGDRWQSITRATSLQ